ncbi:hypothetical protein JKF63_01424 [Porcisia hertigi]|uniref:Uncharacterized protein n=1 Tax=Porcisia hertigi TaxID=2761500 RepID=A0A836KZM2_9TRYP|nr:hypothetical protein JKF63_01424 [Porcisia hertigi]
MLSSFQLRSYRTLEGGAQRQAHDMLRHSVERLWYPFTQGRRGADLDKYRFCENLAGICCPGNTFTCQVNGHIGGTRVLEDFFATLLSGFDIIHASVESPHEKTPPTPADLCNYTGYYVLAHTRTFLGWKPTPTSLRAADPHPMRLETVAHDRTEPGLSNTPADATLHSPSLLNELKGAGNRAATKALDNELNATAVHSNTASNVYTLVVPFTTHVEGLVGHGCLSHLVLRTPVMEILRTRTECPEVVQKCLESSDALRMFAMLRRAGVRPELITANTLLSASKQNEAWSSALGIL